jgi:flagellar hook-length control protein FliK
MPIVEMMESKIQIKASANTLPARPGQKCQNQDPDLDFLRELVTKLPDLKDFESGENREDIGDAEHSGADSTESSPKEQVTRKEQSEPIDDKGFPNSSTESLGLFSPIQDEKAVSHCKGDLPSTSFSFLKLSAEEFGSSPGAKVEYTSNLQSSSSKTLGRLQGQESPGKIPEEDLFENLSPTASPTPKGLEANQGKSREQLETDSVTDQKLALGSATKTEMSTPGKTIFRVTSPIMIPERGEGESPRDQEEEKTGISLFQGKIYYRPLNEDQGSFLGSESGKSSGFERSDKQNSLGKVTNQPEIEPGLNSIPHLDLPDQVHWVLDQSGKSSADFHYSSETSRQSSESGFHKDLDIMVKHQSPTSLEVSLEPEGLGKLDLELNISQDRLHGQFLVQDNAGKDFLERNLPKLLTDLASEGLQIGGFTISLKNQTRGQITVPVRSEFDETDVVPAGSETIVPIQGNHLIHIII